MDAITSLMVERNANIVSGAVHARTTGELVHRGDGARSTGEISIAADGCERCSSREVMIRKRGQDGGTVAVIRASVTMIRVATNTTSSGVSVAGRMEGRRVRVGATVRRNDSFICIGRLPVDRLETLIKLGGTCEFPFAEDSPENCNASD